MDIFAFLIIFTFGFFMGWISHARSMFQKMQEDPDSIIAILKKLKNLQIEEKNELNNLGKDNIKLEIHQGVCYLYDKNDTFLAQGATVSEAMDNAEARFPGLKLDFRLNVPNESNQ